MKRSTLVLGAVALAGVAVVVVVASSRRAPNTAANPPAPGPNGVKGYNAGTLADILGNANAILGGLGFYSKDSQGSFNSAAKPSAPAPRNDAAGVGQSLFAGVFA